MFASLCWSGELPTELHDSLPDRRLVCRFLPNGIVFKVPDAASFEALEQSIRALAAKPPGFDYILTAHQDLRTFGGKATYQLDQGIWNGIVS